MHLPDYASRQATLRLDGVACIVSMDSFFITVPLGLATKALQSSFMVLSRIIRACYSPSALRCCLRATARW